MIYYSDFADFKDAMVNSERAVSLHVDPIAAAPQKPLSVSTLLNLANGNQKLSQEIGYVVDSIMAKAPLPGDLRVSVTGVTIGNLDQFKGLQIDIPLSSAPSSENSGAPLIDTSSLLSGHSLKDLNLKTGAINLETLPHSTLSASAQVGYNNPLPVSVHLPYLHTSVSVGGVEMVQPSLSGLIFDHGDRVVNPSLALYFQQNDASVQDHLANLVSEIKEGKKVDQKVEIHGVYFGTSATDANDLLSQVHLDLTPMLANVKLPDLSGLLAGSSDESTDKKGIDIHSVALKTLPGKSVSLGAHVGLHMNAPLSVKIGTLQAGFSVNSDPLVKAGVDHILLEAGKDVQNVALNTLIVFEETEKTPREVAAIAKTVSEGGKIGCSIGLSQVQIGYSAQDQVRDHYKTRKLIRRLQHLPRY